VGEELKDGTAVAVLVADGLDFHLSAEEEVELEAALAEMRRGEYVDGRELLREIKALSGR
jgi:hypothetical protein